MSAFGSWEMGERIAHGPPLGQEVQQYLDKQIFSALARGAYFDLGNGVSVRGYCAADGYSFRRIRSTLSSVSTAAQLCTIREFTEYRAHICTPRLACRIALHTRYTHPELTPAQAMRYARRMMYVARLLIGWPSEER